MDPRPHDTGSGSRLDAVTRIANRLFPPFLIIVIGIICYGTSFDASFTFDDFPSIVQNNPIKDLGNLKAIWQNSTTRFVAYLSFAVHFRLHGLSLFGYHLVNLVIHLLTALCLFLLVRLLFMTPEGGRDPLLHHSREVATAVSLVFVSHPVEVQAVTYIVQRLASMATLFYLASVVLFLKARISCEEKKTGHVLFTIGSVLMALLAMFTKEISITLPLFILVLEFYFFSPSPGRIMKRVRYLLPILLTLPVIPVTYFATRERLVEQIGIAAETGAISRWEYLLTQINVIRTYLRLLFLPVRQSVDYDYPVTRHLLEPATLVSLILIVALLAAALILFKRYRMVSFGIVWFFLTLSVESSVIPITDVIFEHRLYLPSQGIFLSGCVLGFCILKGRPLVLFAVFSLIVSAASLATISRNIIWKEQVLLWNDALKQAPHKFRAYLNRGVGYSELDKSELALRDYDLAIRINKDHPYPYLNRGLIFMNRGDYESAISEFTHALELQPHIAKAYLDRGLAFLGQGRLHQAYQDFYAAAGIEPKNPFYLNALGAICNRLGRYDLAMLALTKAIALDDAFATPYLNRGKSSLFLGRPDAAMRDLDRAAQLAPHIPEIHVSRGLARVALSDYRTAIKDFTVAVTLNPISPEPLSNRGMAYHRLGLHERALMDLARAIEVAPSLPRLYRNQAKILLSLGREEEAGMSLQRAEDLEGVLKERAGVQGGR